MQFLGVFTNPAFGWNDVSWLRTIRRSCRYSSRASCIPTMHEKRSITESMESSCRTMADDSSMEGSDTRRASRDGRGGSGGECPLLVDSGVRHGADVLKALALGAKAVLLGRPYAYAMASHGEEGVRASHPLDDGGNRSAARAMRTDIDLLRKPVAACRLGSQPGGILSSTSSPSVTMISSETGVRLPSDRISEKAKRTSRQRRFPEES